MTPLSRDLHPSNGRRAPKDEVVVSITSAQHHRGRRSADESWEADEQATQGRGPEDLSPEDQGPDEQLIEMLRLLSEGADDEMVARRLGLELADLRRMLMELGSQLGACNRFQLALHAREEGWI